MLYAKKWVKDWLLYLTPESGVFEQNPWQVNKLTYQFARKESFSDRHPRSFLYIHSTVWFSGFAH